MGHWTHFRLFSSVLITAALCASRVYGQTPSCVDQSQAAATNSQKIKIIVETVEFPSDDQLSDVQRAQITAKIQKEDLRIAPNEPDDSWVGNLEVIRDVLQDQGYLKAYLEMTPHLIKAGPNERHYAVTVQVQSGLQYRLGTVRFENAKVFGSDELRKTIELQEGDLFAAAKIRTGRGRIGKLYTTEGYIDATPEPDFFIHAENNRIDLVLKIDEAKQYRVGTVEIFGLNSSVEDALKKIIQPGQVFDEATFNKLLNERKSLLPSEGSLDRGIQIRRDLAKATVDLVLDFRNCSTIPTTRN